MKAGTQGSGCAGNPCRTVVNGFAAVLCAVLIACSGRTPGAAEPTSSANVEPPSEAASEGPALAPAATNEEAGARIVVKDVGWATPEAVLHDAESDVYLVSNIFGSPFDADDNGFISKLAPDGRVLELKWIDGASETVALDAPKGMMIAAGALYVCDIDKVRMFDAKTGTPRGFITVEGATFLNAVAAGPDGTVYVTDSGLKMGASGFESSGSDAVYRIANGKAEPVIKSKELKGPNGIFADEAGVWVVSFGANELANVKGGKRTDVIALPKGALDGIAKTSDGRWLISSWDAGQVFRGSATEPFTPAVVDVKSPASIGYDSKRNRVLIPLFTENAVVIETL